MTTAILQDLNGKEIRRVEVKATWFTPPVVLIDIDGEVYLRHSHANQADPIEYRGPQTALLLPMPEPEAA